MTLSWLVDEIYSDAPGNLYKIKPNFGDLKFHQTYKRRDINRLKLEADAILLKEVHEIQ